MASPLRPDSPAASALVTSLRDDLAALLAAGSVDSRALAAFDAALAHDAPPDSRIADTTIPAAPSSQA